MIHKRHLVGTLMACSALIVGTMAWAADTVDQNRLNALREAVSGMGRPETPVVTPDRAAQATMCWTPDGQYSAVGVAAEVPYGVRGLAARYESASPMPNTTIKVVWRHNNSTQPVSTGDGKFSEDFTAVANGVLKTESPLLPGKYTASFMNGSTTLATAAITVTPPAPRGSRDIKQVYRQGLTLLDQALKHIDAGSAAPALDPATRALPLLATVMQAEPKDSNAQAAYELAQMAVAVAKLQAASGQFATDQIVDWASRIAAHAATAARLATDRQLKQKAQEYNHAMREAMPKLIEAARQAERNRQ